MDPNANKLLTDALARVESESVKAWAQTAQNGPLFLKMAENAIKRNEADPDRFAAFIVCCALGM